MYVCGFVIVIIYYCCCFGVVVVVVVMVCESRPANASAISSCFWLPVYQYVRTNPHRGKKIKYTLSQYGRGLFVVYRMRKLIKTRKNKVIFFFFPRHTLP